MTVRTLRITDARVRRLLAESYALAYGVTAVALGRAVLSAPRLHGLLGVLAVLCSAALRVVRVLPLRQKAQELRAAQQRRLRLLVTDY